MTGASFGTLYSEANSVTCTTAAHHGSLTTAANGKLGTAYETVNDQVCSVFSIGTSDMDISNTDFSLAFWIRPGTYVASDRVFVFLDGTFSDVDHSASTADTIVSWIKLNEVVAHTSFNPSQWIHITYSWECKGSVVSGADPAKNVCGSDSIV